MCFFRKRREKKKALQEEQLRMQQESMKKESIAEEKPTPAPTIAPIEPRLRVVPKVEKENVKKEVDAPPKKVAKKEEPKVQQKVEDSKNPKYHVAQNKDAKSNYYKQWRVRKEGSSKTIKYFDTQAEAIKYAEELADKNDTSVVIHKLDGSIRKQDYQK